MKILIIWPSTHAVSGVKPLQTNLLALKIIEKFDKSLKMLMKILIIWPSTHAVSGVKPLQTNLLALKIIEKFDQLF